MVSDKRKAQIEISLSGILMGNAGIFILGLNFLTTNAIVALRGLFGLIFVLVLITFSKGWKNILDIFRLSPVLLIIQSIISPFTSFFYFYSIQNAGFGPAAFLLKTGPIYSVIILAFVLKSMPKKIEMAGFLIVVIGVLILTEPWKIFGIIQSSSLGISAGICSGLLLGASNAIRVVIHKKIEKSQQLFMQKTENGLIHNKIVLTGQKISISMLLLELFVTFSLFTILDSSYYITMNPIHWLYALGLGVISTGLPFYLRNKALKHDVSGDVLIFSYSETIMGALLTGVIDHALTYQLIIGGLFILFANFLVIYSPYRVLTSKIDHDREPLT